MERALALIRLIGGPPVLVHAVVLASESLLLGRAQLGLVEELVGDIRDEYDSSAADTRTLAGGDVEVDGLLNIDDFMRDTSMALPDGPYETVAGFMVATLGRVPHVGDVVEEQGRRLEVSAMDGRRVARIRVAAAPVDDSISDNNHHA